MGDTFHDMLEDAYKKDEKPAAPAAPKEETPNPPVGEGAAGEPPKEEEGEGKRDKSGERDRSRKSRSRSPRRRRSRSRSRSPRRRRRSRSRSRDRRSSRDDRRHGGRRSRSPRRASYRSRSRSRSPRRRGGRSRSRSGSPGLDAPQRAVELTDEERDARTIMVQQLPRKCMPHDLIKHFSQAGPVQDAKMIADRNSRRSKGIAYIEFVDPESVEKALAMDGQKLGPAPLRIMPTMSEKNRQAALKERELASGGPCRISIHNLPFAITSEQLKELFNEFAKATNLEVKDGAVLPDPQGRGSSGTGFIEFSGPAAAQIAVEKMNNEDIMGRHIRVSLSASTGESINTMPNMVQPAVPPGMMPHGMMPPGMMPPGMMPPGMMPPPGMPPPGGPPSMLDNDKVDRSGVAMSAMARQQMMASMMGAGAGAGGQPPLMGMVPPAGMPPGMAPPLGMAPPPMPQQHNPNVPTQQILMKNMFDPDNETDPDWDKDIQDEVLEECSTLGPVVHIQLDKASKGHVYVKFVDATTAIKCHAKMHNRNFDGQKIAVEYMSEADYAAKFPAAANASTPLSTQ